MSPSLVCVPGVTKCVALGSYVKGCDLLSVQHCLLWHVPQNGVYLLCHERRFGVRVCSVASQFVCAVAACVVFDGGCWWADVPKMQQRKGGAARAVGDVPCWHSLQHQRAAWMLALSQFRVRQPNSCSRMFMLSKASCQVGHNGQHAGESKTVCGGLVCLMCVLSSTVQASEWSCAERDEPFQHA